MTVQLHTFETPAILAEKLAAAVADALATSIAATGSASIAVSGGSTPKAFFKALSNAALDWSKVTVTLVDERFVPPESDRSNEKLVRDNLLTGAAVAAAFQPLYYPTATAEEAAATATKETARIGRPFDVVVLGMGGDGHTASFFPGGSRLAEALDPQTPRGVMTMQADGAGEPRLTYTFTSLADARLLVLHIEGDAKKTVLETAQGGGPETDMPVRAILRRAASPVEIYWAS
ncbi:6-phosphogluconolactonase [Rhizobium sp. Leaf371]|uniref:6-phosphogluconolactonase n=1 Tax=Rhizobium sp. Leaf371 TaxID=1736355 RepID=UPI0007151905|nr:6-phosphogluconolactonase [Rhizobium sp. Leaf371]KQS65108.1 6-phosphogluconolactonase [Rhizobium sp. Leaf371]